MYLPRVASFGARPSDIRKGTPRAVRSLTQGAWVSRNRARCRAHYAILAIDMLSNREVKANRRKHLVTTGEDSACYPLPDREYSGRRNNRRARISENKRGPAMQGNGLAGSSTRLSLVPRTAWCYEQTNEATDQPSGGNAPPDGVIQWAERLWLVPEQKKMNIAPEHPAVGAAGLHARMARLVQRSPV